jgi:hypothetical protein
MATTKTCDVCGVQIDSLFGHNITATGALINELVGDRGPTHDPGDAVRIDLCPHHMVQFMMAGLKVLQAEQIKHSYHPPDLNLNV